MNNFFSSKALIATLAMLSSRTVSVVGRELIVFGDSLSDTGNYYAATAALGGFPPSPPYDVPPSPPDDAGRTGRATNGDVWVEYLAGYMGVPVPEPSSVVAGGTNYAFSGAVTGSEPVTWNAKLLVDLGIEFPLTGGLPLQLQVGAFLDNLPPSSSGDSSQDDLFVIWAGANDFLLDGKVNIKKIAKNIKSAIETLIDEGGATQFLVLNMPSLDTIPAVVGVYPSLFLDSELDTSGIGAKVTAFNEKLREEVDDINEENDDVEVIYVDVPSLLSLATAIFGLEATVPVLNETNLFGPIFSDGLVGDPTELFQEEDPTGSLFWDGVHPTTTAHGLVGLAACCILGPASCDAPATALATLCPLISN